MESSDNEQRSVHNPTSYSPYQGGTKFLRRSTRSNSKVNNECKMLHTAIDQKNFDTVCMLLYYETDINTLDNRNLSPLTHALHLNNLEIAEVLFPFHNDYSLKNIYGYTVLHLAAWRKTSIAIELVKAGVDVNCITNYGDTPLVFSLQYDNAELFKLIWPKCDFNTLLYCEKPFLLTYIETLRFPVTEWLECINLILDSSTGFKLMEHCRSYLQENNFEYGFFWELMHSFQKINVEPIERKIIISKCLSLGATVNLFDISFSVDSFLYTEEFEILIYNMDWSLGTSIFDYHFIFPLPICICGIENLNSDMLVDILKKQILLNYNSFNPGFIQKAIVNSLGFFSLSFQQKQEIISTCELYLKEFSEITKKLDVIPELPSLLELSRNKIREIVKETANVKKIYQYYDVVKTLNLPENVKDILKFKKPLY